MSSRELHTLTGAYAVGALSGPEVEEFRRHVSLCQACAQEVRELQETAARLALAVAQVPSAGMRERVMAALPEVRQLPPDMAEIAVATAHGRTWRQRLPLLAVAVCLALAAVTTGLAVDAHHEADVQRDRTARAEQQAMVLNVLTSAPDATFRTGRLTGGGTATVVASKRLGQAAVLYLGLPALPGAKVYELWFSRGGTMVPAGLLEPGRTAGSALLTGSPSEADAVGITAEPHGGSPTPTSAPLALLSL